jgi:hypothetical protein
LQQEKFDNVEEGHMKANNEMPGDHINQLCSDIASSDEKYNEITQRSMLAYQNLTKAFAEYVNITTELHAYSEKLMLYRGIHINKQE